MTVSVPEGWVEIVDARDDIEAQLVLGTLLEAGIEAQSMKTNSGPGAWLTGTQVQWSPVAILVPVEHADEARALLSGQEVGDLQTGGSVDPMNDSAEMVAPRSRGRAWLVWVVAIFVLLALVAGLLTDVGDIIGV